MRICAMSVVEGQLLAGKYRVQRILGQGGMGVVVAAHHVVLDQAVAIKFLLPESLRNAETVARFEREARAAVKIQSEHVVRVTDVGRFENGAPYMVMELLRGRDLDALLRERGPLPLADVADYVLQAGEAIAEAHGLGIVHRDLKPSNLFLTQRADGSTCVKILDFGISKLIASSSDEQGMTSTTAVMGSPLYMSPEQLMSARDVDMRSDIWSLGVICFELLTGKLPFRAETLPQLCMAIQLSPPTPVRNYRPDLPLEVETVLLRCLTKDPGRRYATVAELAAELVRFAPAQARVSFERIERLARAAGYSASARTASPSLAGTTADESLPGNRTVAEFGRTKPGASSSKIRLGLGLVALLAAGSVASFTLWRRPPPTPAPALASALNASLPLIESSAPRAPAPLASVEPMTPVASGRSASPEPSSPAPPVVSMHQNPPKPPHAIPPTPPPLALKATPSAAPASSKPLTFGGRL
jgi:serine/threonine-protein kinase